MLALNQTIGEPMWGPKTYWAQQGLHGCDIQKLGVGDTPKIHAGVKGQNWGSTNRIDHEGIS